MKFHQFSIYEKKKNERRRWGRHWFDFISNLLKFNGPHTRPGTPNGTEWAMPSGFFIKDVIRLNWTGDAWPGGMGPPRFFDSVGRLRHAWVVKTRRNLCGELLLPMSDADNAEEAPPPLPESTSPSGCRPEPIRVGESEWSLWRRNDLLLKSNNGEDDEKWDIFFFFFQSD